METDITEPLQRTIHTVIKKYEGYFVAMYPEVSVVTDGPTIDEVVCNLQEAVGLLLDGEDPAGFGLVPNPGVTLIYQMELAVAAA